MFKKSHLVNICKITELAHHVFKRYLLRIKGFEDIIFDSNVFEIEVLEMLFSPLKNF
jgi:hypothetical protein